MAVTTPTLYPNPMIRRGQTLSVSDGWLVVSTTDGKSERFRIGARAPGPGSDPDGGVATLAHYYTRVRPPSSEAARMPGVLRSSWRLLDGNGQPLVWLSNIEQALYDFDQARAFCEALGIEFRDFGMVSTGDLLATRPRSRLNGPGTGRISATAAPLREWGLTLAVLAGVLFTAPVVASFWEDGSVLGIGGPVVLVAALGFVLGAAFLCGRTSGGIAALGWRKFWRGRSSEPGLLLSASRLPGLALAAGASGLEIRDLQKAHTIARDSGLALQTYEIESDGIRPPHGLLVRNPNEVAANIPVHFDPQEVHAFCGSLGAQSLRLLKDAEQVPKPDKQTSRLERGNREGGPFKVGKPSLYAWGILGWLLTVLSPVLTASALVVLIGPLDLSWFYAALCGGGALLAAATWVLYVAQTPIHLRRPDLFLARIQQQA